MGGADAAFKFNATRTKCNGEKAKVTPAAAVYLEDSLCSQAEMMLDLNLVLGNMGIANKHIDDSSTAQTKDYLVNE